MARPPEPVAAIIIKQWKAKYKGTNHLEFLHLGNHLDPPPPGKGTWPPETLKFSQIHFPWYSLLDGEF